MKVSNKQRVLGCLAVLVGLSLPLEVPARNDISERMKDEGRVRLMVRMALPEARSMSFAPVRKRDRAQARDRRRERIAQARERIAEPLRRRGALEVVRGYSEVPWVAVEVDEEGLEALRDSPDVAALVVDRLERVQLLESTALIGANTVNSRGISGRGWTIAVLDTGVDSSHSFLAGRVVGEACFSAGGSCPDGSTEMIGPGAGAACDYGDISCGHGTHVAGIAAGRGPGVSGVAPAADIISIQIFSEFSGEDCEDLDEDPCALSYLSDITSALEYLYSIRDEIPIAAINLSIGGELYSSVSQCEAEDPRTEIVGLLREAGIAVVAAAGNESSVEAMTTPACLSDVVSVASSTDEDRISDFSNTPDFLDFFAPGAQIRSSVPGGGYRTIRGSSQATPHVAGAYALLFEALGGRDLEISTEVLRVSGRPIRLADRSRQVPRVQLDEALELLAVDRRATGLQITPDGKRTLLSKDLAGERWAIVLNGGDGSVSGNVFLQDGSEPAFVSCVAAGDAGERDSAGASLGFACEGASRCQGDCADLDWTSLGSVTLPESFFLPRPRYPLPPASSASGAGARDSRAGVREIPGQERVLVSKDAGGKRWAIAWNGDGSVTGNVYDPAGGPPQFVWCSDEGDDGNPRLADRRFRFQCFGADPCYEGTCGPATWTDIGEVTLPGSFFQP